MKLYPPIYPGDSVLQPGTLPGGDAESTAPKAAFLATFVRSSTDRAPAPQPRIDLLAIEERARAARNAWISKQLQAVYAALAHRVERAKQASLENRLDASQPVCER